MPNVTFTVASGLADSVFGLYQEPIQRFIESRAEEFEKQSLLKELFCMDNTKNPVDAMTAMTAMDGFMPVGENGSYPTTGMQESYKKTLHQETWKSAFSLSQEAVEDGKLMDLKKQPSQFMTSYHRTRERFGASLFGAALTHALLANFANKQYDISSADGVPMFSTAHPSIVDKKLVQANAFSNVFSADALGMAETAMQSFKGDKGEILGVAPDTIVIPNNHNLKKKVFEAVGSEFDPDSNDNAFSYQYGRWTILVWPYLNEFLPANAQPWLLMDSTYNQEYGSAVWLERIALAVRSTIDDNNDANVWRGRSRFAATFNDWRGFCAGGITGGTALS